MLTIKPKPTAHQEKFTFGIKYCEWICWGDLSKTYAVLSPTWQNRKK
jgi:hypothetical protein